MGARQIALREGQGGLGLFEAGLRLSQGDLEGPAIDREQKIALFTICPSWKWMASR